jgi:hypothetical protein
MTAQTVSYNGELGETVGCIEVINLSNFPVTVAETGFTVTGKRKNWRQAITSPMASDRQPFARTLEPRSSVTCCFDLKILGPRIKKAYVRTSCGEFAYGVSPALKRMKVTNLD